MLKDRGEKFKAEDSTEIASKIKEKYGYVCKDVLKEYKKYDEKVVDANGNITQSKKFRNFVHKTINGNMVNIDVGYERFLGPEMFFHPVSQTLSNSFFRNSSTRIGPSHLARLSTMLFKAAQSTIEFSCIRTLFCQEAARCLRALINVLRARFKTDLTNEWPFITRCQAVTTL
jgi:hypothetical protein